MSTPRNQWLLKVIAGPNQGAEVGVRVGKMLIGSDDECDVVLHDVLVAPQHVEIEATATGIMVAPLGGRVFINGKRVRDARQTVPDFAFVSVGGSHIIIGPENAKWPLLSAADVPELEKEVEPVDTPPVEVAAQKEKIAPENTAVIASSPVKKDSRTRAYFGIAAGVSLLLVWFVAYLKYSGDSTKEQENGLANSKPADRVRAVVVSMGLSDSIKIEESAGHVAVSGYVDTEARQRELQAAFRQAVPGLHTRIYSLEKIASSARALLDDEPLPLTVTSLSEGRIKVTGKLRSADPWVRMRQTLRRSVPGISEIEDGVEIETPGLAPQQLRLAVPQAPARTTAVAEPRPVPVPVTAAAPDSDPGTDYLVTASTIDTLQATVATITAGSDSLSYVRLSSGGIYFEGARLPYGGKITRIDPNTVTIDEKGTTRILQQGDLVVKSKIPISSASNTSTKSP